MRIYNDKNAPLLIIKNNGKLTFSEFLGQLYRHAGDIDKCTPYFLLGMGGEAFYLSCLEYIDVYEEWLRLYGPLSEPYKIASALVIPASVQALLQTNQLQPAIYARHTILEDSWQAYNWLDEIRQHELLRSLNTSSVWQAVHEPSPLPKGSVIKQI